MNFVLRFITNGKIWLLGLGFISGMTVYPLPSSAQEPTQTPSATDVNKQGGAAPTTAAAGTSDSGPMKDRLRFRVARTLGTSGPTLGQPGGYHWIFLVQVARYPDSNVRFTNVKSGIEAFLSDLDASRQTWPSATTQDTVSIIPYHFNILGESRARKQLLIGNLTSIKERVPDAPVSDIYGDGQRYRDGHDWRNALMQTLTWMEQTDTEASRAIIVVLDWNSVIQPPQLRDDGTKAVGDASYLVVPENQERMKVFRAALKRVGIQERNLETVQVGNLEYAMGVFAAQNLQPLPVPQPTTPTATPRPTPGGGTGGGIDWGQSWPLLLLVPVMVLLFNFVKPHSLKINNDRTFEVRALGGKTLELLGPNGKSKSGTLSLALPDAPYGGNAPLAHIGVDWRGRVLVTKGALRVKPLSGFKRTTNDIIELTGPNGQFEMRDSSDQLIKVVSVRRV